MEGREAQDQAPFFSIVMPVHGVERHIADAVADALVQTDRDFELILVDDCSPDRSIETARAVAGGDVRMRIVRLPENRGVSAARNAGIDAARGTWLIMPDPDDRFEENLLERMRCAIRDHDPDIVYFNHADDCYGPDGSFLFRNDLSLAPAVLGAGADLAREAIALEQGTHLGYPWNKAFRLDIVRRNGVRFEDGAPLIEDFLFTMEYLRHVEALVAVPDVLYWYAKRLGHNLTARAESDYYAMHRRRIQVLRDFAAERDALDGEAKAVLGSLYARFILSSIEQTFAPQSRTGRAERRAWLEGVFEDELFRELVDHAQASESRMLSISLDLFKARNASALIAEGAVTHAMRTHAAPLYLKAKSGR